MESTLRILILEDIEEDVDLIKRTLQKAGLQFEAMQVDTREGFIQALQDFNSDVILSDHSLPQFDSVEALSLFKKTGSQIPFILVTGAVSEEFAVSCLKQGADDYVLKSNLARLPNAIANALKQKEAEQAKVTAAQTLQSQNAELKKINKELDSFVYSVSHNLRAPLMSVLGLLDLAKNESHTASAATDALDQYFAMMESSIHKLDETVKEILDYSRNARQNLTIEKIDLKKMIDDNFEKMQFMSGSRLIARQIKIDEKNSFYSDNYRLSVILNNLISNAIKYYDQNKNNPFIKITVIIDNEKVMMEFADNGIGIEEAYIAKVFDMFFRGTEQNKGAGLGLYIVKEAIEKLNGKIVIESKVGKGTIFKIELPNYISNTHPATNDQLEVAIP